MKLDLEELGQFVWQRHQDLTEKRRPWDAWWNELAMYVMPRYQRIGASSDVALPLDNTILFDDTGIQCNIILSNGQLDWMTPHGSRWFSFDAPARLRGIDVVEQWFKYCSEIVALELARSNFYSQIHQVYLDRGAFGTAVLHCESGRSNFLNFKKFAVGTYSLAENDEGAVDTISREFMLTARQAMQWFGRESLSNEIVKSFDERSGKRREKEFCFIHQCFPRAMDEIELGKMDAQNKPFASIYLEKKEKKVVRVSGYEEQPFFATRYLPWECTPNAVYGWCPAAYALADMRQLNFLQKQLDALAEVKAFPRMLFPDTHKDEIDLRASGITYYDSANPNGVPRTWATEGEYNVGLDRVAQKQKSVREAFHVDIFRMFGEGQLDKTMTAREVAERSSEKLGQVSPTFATMTSEFLSPVLQRVFKMHLRGGMFPPPPKEIMIQDPTGIYMPEPEVTYSSRIALAIKALENVSFSHVSEMWKETIPVKPEIMDNFNWDRAFRDTARNSGLPARWLMDERQMAEIRQSRAQQQAEMERMQKMEMMSKAAGEIGSVKQDSVAGGAIAGLLGGGQRQNGATPAAPARR